MSLNRRDGNMNKLRKRTVAGLVVASMVSTVLSPALPVYAANYGDNVTIAFHTGDGPSVGLYGGNWDQLPADSNTARLTGRAGYLLKDEPVSMDLLPMVGAPDLLDRPKLPDWDGVTLDESWDGYEFDGWYTAEDGGTKVDRLHPAFPYNDVTYYARWKGDPLSAYDLTIKHLAEISVAGSLQDVEFYYTPATPKVTGTTISTSYKRTIPGFKFEGDAEFSPEKMRKYGEASGAGTGKTVGSFNSSHVFMGTMPNDDMEVTYRYVVDTDKRFNFRVEHVNASNTAIASTQVSQKYAGEAITAGPLTGAAVSGYIYDSVEIVTGDVSTMDTTGVYGLYYVNGSTGGFGTSNPELFSGVMPNQAVTLRYKYDVDPLAQSSVTVSYVDDQGRDLVADGVITGLDTVYTTAPSGTLTIPVPDLQSQGYLAGVNPNWTGLTSATMGTNNITVVTGSGAGTLTLQYVVDQSDTTNWARLTFLTGANGGLVGNSSPQIIARGTYDINSDGSISDNISDGFTIVADPFYMADGWYYVNGANPTGSKLETLNITGDTKIMFCFKEDPSMWVDIRFAAGANGSVSSSASQHLKKGTAWDTVGVQIPAATPASGYMFIGWYDSTGNLVWDGSGMLPSDEFVTTTYTAKFAPINQETGHDRLNRPDAAGSIGSDGRGVIKVSNPADNCRYVVTDVDGTVLAELTAAQIESGSNFASLTPGSSYNVYEVSSSAPALTPGSSVISDVTSEMRSYPSRVIIPASGDNVTVEADTANEGKAKIVIKPAAAGTDYALLDENGDLVYDWASPSGSPLEVVFDNLDPDTVYVVVTKDTTGTESAESKKDYGTDVLTDIDSIAIPEYMIQIIGGTVETIDGESTGTTEAQVREGQAVKITAPATVSGRDFKEWKVVIGSISGFTTPSQRTRTITMPAKNVVLVATYEDDPLATSSDASLEYRVNSGSEGKVGLDMSPDKLDDMRADVTTAEDATLIGEGRNVTYRIQFTKRQAVATESDAVKAERGQYNDAFKAAFALDVELLRFVDGKSRPVEDGTDPGPLDILIQIDADDWNHLDYQLWEIGDGGAVSEITPLNADPNSQPEYGGYFMFTGNANSLYVMSYSKTQEVTITDSSAVAAGNNEVFKVRKGEGLEDNSDYQSWSPVDPYTDSTGATWVYVGLSTRNGRYTGYEFDDTQAITKNKTVYTYYESDDQDWNDIKKKLEDEIQTANDLMNNGSVSQEDKDRLQDAIDAAESVLNQSPRATIQELEDAYDELKDVVDSITGFIPPVVDQDWINARDKLVNEIKTGESLKNNSKVSQANKDKLQNAINEANAVLNKVPQPTTQELIDAYYKLNSVIVAVNNSINTGGNGGGGGGGGGTIKRPSTTYPTYTVGTDGNWQLIDEASDSWAFVLNSGNRVNGTWAYLKYVSDGVTNSYYYHFGADGIMNSGWYLDTDGHWYYLSQVHDGWFGRMETGWHYDSQDQKWYYLDTDKGYMVTGWKQVGDAWYYFSPQPVARTWGYNESQSRWEFLGSTERPYGSMYTNEQTPDGYRVGGNGAMTQ